MSPEFWLMLCSVALIFFIYKPVKNSIISYIDREILRIQGSIISARESRVTAEADVKALQKQLDFIKKERDEILDKANAHAAQIALDNAKELEMLIKHKEQDAKHQIEYLKTEAIDELRASFAEGAQSLTKAYLQKHAKELKSDVAIAMRLMDDSL